MKKNLPFRAWFYFRQGWGLYFAFILAAINTMTTTFYLAIKDVPSLKVIFPSFGSYILILSAIGIPLLVLIGYIHFKKSPAFSSESDISAESQPYNYKIPPGYNREALFPLYLAMSTMLIKLLKNEKLTDAELKEITKIQNKINLLIKGEFIGKPNTKSDITDFDKESN